MLGVVMLLLYPLSFVLIEVVVLLVLLAGFGPLNWPVGVRWLIALLFSLLFSFLVHGLLVRTLIVLQRMISKRELNIAEQIEYGDREDASIVDADRRDADHGGDVYRD